MIATLPSHPALCSDHGCDVAIAQISLAPATSAPDLDTIGYGLRAHLWRMQQASAVGRFCDGRLHQELQRRIATAQDAGLSADAIRSAMYPARIADAPRERAILPSQVVATWDAVRSALVGRRDDRRVILTSSALGSRYDISLEREAIFPGDRYMEIERSAPGWSKARLRIREVVDGIAPDRYVDDPRGTADPHTAVALFLDATVRRQEV